MSTPAFFLGVFLCFLLAQTFKLVAGGYTLSFFLMYFPWAAILYFVLHRIDSK